ncbi:MAG: glycosyltransferase family 39 protein [Candidatus Woesearchaeota archaeon]|nr:MAG: glycosyltransferase family 39 protein [Candidatus Woesearchaeota archaeon]
MKLSNEFLFLALLLLFTSLVSFYNLGAEPLWLDEAISVRQAQAGFSEGMTLLSGDVHLPLHHVLLWTQVHLFGISEFSVRFLSALFGVLAVGSLYVLGKKLYSKRVGFLAAALLAFSTLGVYYVQEARLYSLFMFLSVASLLAFFTYVEKPTKRNAVYYFVATVLLMYTHIFAFFIIGAQFVYYLLVHVKNRKKTLRWLLLHSLLFVAFLPWLPILYRQIFSVIGHFWIPQPTLVSLLISFHEFSGSLLIVLAIFCIILAYSYFVYRKKIVETRTSFFLFSWLVIPFFVVFIYSQFFTPLYQTRYFLFALPIFYLLLSVGIDRVCSCVKNNWLFPVISLVFVLLFVIALAPQQTTLSKDDWRSISAFLKEQVGEDDYIFIHPFYHQDPFTYYFDQDCFSQTNVYVCNFEKHNIVSLNNQTSCCSDDSLLTSTLEQNTLSDFLTNTIWLVSVRSTEYVVDPGLFNYLSEQKSLEKHYVFTANHDNRTVISDWGTIDVWKFS